LFTVLLDLDDLFLLIIVGSAVFIFFTKDSDPILAQTTATETNATFQTKTTNSTDGSSSVASFIDFVSDRPIPEKVVDHLVIIGGFRRRLLSDIEAISLDEDVGNCNPTDLPYKVCGHSSVYSPVVEGIVTCGGMGGMTFDTLSKCILQRKRNNSNQFPSLNSKRRDFSLTAISNKIFAIGGYPNSNTMETMNLNTDRQWKKEELPFSVSGHCSVGLGNKIIVTGGYNQLDSTWIYDIVSRTWNEGPKMNTKRRYHSCFVDQATSSVYVIGGRNDQLDIISSTEKWTFGQTFWQPLANLPVAITNASAVSSNEKVFVGYMAGGWHEGYRRYSNIIFGLRRRDMAWVKLIKRMKLGREGNSLLNIPAKHILGC